MQSNNDGLFQAELLNRHGSHVSLNWDEIRDWITDTGLLWMHLDYTNSTACTWLKEESGLDSLIAEALLAEDTRPRCDSISGGLLISLRGVNNNPGADPEDMVSIRLFIDENRIISTGRRNLMSVLDIVESLKAGEGPSAPGGWIATLTNRLISRMSTTIEDMEERLTVVEEALLNVSDHNLRMDLLELRREAIMLRRYLSPQREAMNQLMLASVEWLTADDRLRIREASDKLTRHIEDLDAFRDRGMVASEELASRIVEQMNVRMYVLSLIAGVFLPLGFLTGLLGINVAGIPGSENPWGFIAVLVALVLIAFLQLLIFRRKGWF